MKEWDAEEKNRSGGASAPVEAVTPSDLNMGTFRGVRQFKPRRLPDFDYSGRNAYHLVAVTTNRRTAMVNAAAELVVSALTEAAAATKFDLLTFLVMPDHVHIMAVGAADDANAIRFMQRFKQLSGFRYKQRHGTPLWQHSFYDRVLRRDEDLLNAARYILGNPVRAGLISADEVWPYQGGTLLADDKRASATSPVGAEAPPLREYDAVQAGAEAPPLREYDAASAGASAPPLRVQDALNHASLREVSP